MLIQRVKTRFKKLAEPAVVWDHSISVWRLREPPDDPESWKQSKHGVAVDPETDEYITAYAFEERYGRPPLRHEDVSAYSRLEASLVGVQHADNHGHDRQSVLRSAGQTATADLIREPDNEFDKNAIAVYIGGLRAGYVPGDVAKDLSPIIDTLEWHFTVPHMWIRQHYSESHVTAKMIIELRRGRAPALTQP